MSSVFLPSIFLPRTFHRLDTTQLAVNCQNMSRVTPPPRSDNDGPRPHLVLSGEEKNFRWLEYLPDGRRVVTGSWRGTVQVWNVESGEQEGTSMKQKGGISDLAVTLDGTKIISSGLSGIKVWDVKSHELVKEWTHRGSCPKIAITPDGQLLAVGRWNVDIYSMEGRHVDSIEVGVIVWLMCFSPNGNKLACGTEDGIRVYDVDSGTLMILGLGGHRVFDVLWSRDGSRLFASKGGTIQCWNSDTGQQIGHPWTGHTNYICSLSLSPDGSILASASYDKTVRFWNAITGDPVGQHLQHDHGVKVVCSSPSGDSVASAGVDGKIYIWQVVECLGQCQTSNFKYVSPVVCSTMI